MARASLSDLPTELQVLIMKHLIIIMQPKHDQGDGYSNGRTTEQSDQQEDLRSSSTFPFNVASAWSVWRDILVLLPECWTRVAFDLAKDPTPFLEAFTWSGDLINLELVVHNTSDSSRVTDSIKIEESQRVSAIFSALSPHMPRCKSIIFDTMFSSSLPQPNLFFLEDAPHLQELTLECSVDDIDLNMFQPPAQQWRQQLSFPKLKKLSLTGFWFMFLVQQTYSELEWLQQLKLPGYQSSLSVSRFAFPETGSYSFENLIRYLSVIHSQEIHLLDLSLLYQPNHSMPRPANSYQISSDLHLHSVSKSFISHLDAFVDHTRKICSFEKCELPTGIYSGDGRSLTFDSISNVDGLQDILVYWKGGDLSIKKCPSFNDDVLQWLGVKHVYTNKDGKSYESFPAPWLRSLAIDNCPGLTASALATFIRNRRRGTSRGSFSRNVLFEVHVTGNGIPRLTDEERERFKNIHTNEFGVMVSWTVFKNGDFVWQHLNWFGDKNVIVSGN